jgi:hypothetical protein
MKIPLNRLGIEWNPCEQGKGRIRFYDVETEKADYSLQMSAGAVESWWFEKDPDDVELTSSLYRVLCDALLDGVDRTLINEKLTNKVGEIMHCEAGQHYLAFMPTYTPPFPRPSRTAKV